MFHHYQRKTELPVISHLGFFRRRIGMWEAVALMLGGMIGAGCLGIPYAVAKVGLVVGIMYILFLGILMIGLNLMVGEIAVRTKEPLQFVGFAGKYLGKWGKIVMMLLIYVISFAVQAIYLIGEGETLSTLFGGQAFTWALCFWLVSATVVTVGIQLIKRVEMILLLGLLTVVFLVVVFSAPHLSWPNFTYHNLANILFPYGVILFALSGAGTVPEAHALLGRNNKIFKKAIIISGSIGIFVYLLFTVMVVGVTGNSTTEIATVGLGRAISPMVLILGNLFAILALGGCSLINALSLRDSLSWDWKLSPRVASMLVCLIPLAIYLLGMRSFIGAIDLVGGVFVSLQVFLVLLIYWRAKSRGDLPVGKYHLHHTVILAILLVLALTIGAVYSLLKIF